ncbi:hypothetical protein D3C87_1954080 [compost metagenome]
MALGDLPDGTVRLGQDRQHFGQKRVRDIGSAIFSRNRDAQNAGLSDTLQFVMG